MLNRLKNRPPIDYACLLFITIVTLLAVAFVWTDTLGSYSDDSVSYIIMAQAMSPYFDTADVIIQGAKLEQYPPLFSFFLAITGISHHYLASHISVAMMFGVTLFLTYWLSIHILKNRRLAMLVTVIFALSPSAWLNMLGILSENMYIILSLGFIILINNGNFIRAKLENNVFNIKRLHQNWIVQLSSILILLILCRSLGIALVAAYAVCFLLREHRFSSVYDTRLLIPIVTPVLAAASWSMLRDSSDKDLYASDVNTIFLDIFNSPSPIQHFFSSITPQISSFHDSWHTAFELYWLSNLHPTHLIIGFFGICTIAGIILRLKEKQLDAWYVLFYLLILLVWPYPDQFNRFIYVLMPLFIIQGVYFLKFILDIYASDKSVFVSTIALLFIIVSVAPASAFIFGRATNVTPFEKMDFSHIAPYYNIPDIDAANRAAFRHEHLRQDLQMLNDSLGPDDITMWYTPNYIRLVAQRKAVRFPDTQSTQVFLQKIKDSKINYVFSTELNPRYTNESFDGLEALAYFRDFTDVVWTRKHPITGKLTSTLLKINQPQLLNLLQHK